MQRTEEIKDFLVSRRAAITPEQAGLPNFGAHRRVKGLRREEVAMLAGVSAEYYTKLERGSLGGASESVLSSLATALKLTYDERSYLFTLARNQSGSKPIKRTASSLVLRPNLQQIIERIELPVFVRNTRLDVLGLNPLGKALFPWLIPVDGVPANTARYIFLNAESKEYFIDWHKAATDAVSLLRMQAARDPYDRALTDLIGELSTLSAEFRQLWAKHSIGRSQVGQKRFNHPLVGALELNYEVLTVAEDPNLLMLIYSPVPGSIEVSKLQTLKSAAAQSKTA